MPATEPVAIPSSVQPPPSTERLRYLRDSVSWLVHLRWLAIMGIVAAVLISHSVGWSRRIYHPLGAAVALALCNLAVWRHCQRCSSSDRTRALLRQIAVQLHIDLVALALLLYWTGGVANPFVIFFVFPVATGAIMLSTKAALLIGSSACALFTALVLLEVSDLAPRQPFDMAADHLDSLMHHAPFVVGLLTAAAMTLFGIVYFIRTVVAQHEHADERSRQHERIALSRERMARVGMIAAGVAHSVRNPLHGVLNCIDLVRTSRSREEVQETLSLMQEGLSRIEKVTARLLALSREAPLAPQQVDLDELVIDTLRLLEVRMQKQGVDLRTELAGVHSHRLDPTRLQEALFNILDNAIAAMVNVRERWVLVRTNRIQQPFPGASIEVIDSGVGVDESVSPHVFDPFFSTKPVGEGTGLGLAIAKEVVEAHGGVIQFLSKRNAGTTVRILLPDDPGYLPEGGGA